MSRFEDVVATRKRAERKERQQFLQDQISGYKMGSFTVGEAYHLFKFFALADPSHEELMEATGMIEGHITGIRAFWEQFHSPVPPQK